MKRKYIFICLFAVLLGICLFSDSDQAVKPTDSLDCWIGSYSYHEETRIERFTGMGLNIHIYKSQTIYYADIEADGRSLSIRARAIVTGTADQIELRFQEITDKGKDFEPNELLLVMERIDDALYTEWGAIRPLHTDYDGKGIFLQKEENAFLKLQINQVVDGDTPTVRQVTYNINPSCHQLEERENAYQLLSELPH